MTCLGEGATDPHKGDCGRQVLRSLNTDPSRDQPAPSPVVFAGARSPRMWTSTPATDRTNVWAMVSRFRGNGGTEARWNDPERRSDELT